MFVTPALVIISISHSSCNSEVLLAVHKVPLIWRQVGHWRWSRNLF